MKNQIQSLFIKNNIDFRKLKMLRLKEKSNKKKISKNTIGIIYGFCLFLLAQPYFIWNGDKTIYLVIEILILSLSLFYLKNNYEYQIYDFILLPVLFLLFFYSLQGQNISGFIIGSFPIIFFFIKSEKFSLFFYWFKVFFAISIFLSLITYVLIYVFHISIIYHIIQPLNHFKSYTYKEYPFLVMPNGFDVDATDMFRFPGMFDEPGVIGTFAAIILVSEKFKLKSFINITIFIGGLVSLSFFFIITSAVFAFYYLNNKFRFVLLFIIVISFFLTKDNPMIDSNVWKRFEIENGKLYGDNRTSAELDTYYKSFLKSNDVLVGKGANYIEKYDAGLSASYKQFIIDYGLVFSIIIYLFFLIYALITIKEKKNKFVFVILFSSVMFQRPFIFQPIYFYLIVSSIYMLSENNTEKGVLIKIRKNKKMLIDSNK